MDKEKGEIAKTKNQMALDLERLLNQREVSPLLNGVITLTSLCKKLQFFTAEKLEPSSSNSDCNQLFRHAQSHPYLSHVMRKPTFCICENKDADQLRGYGNREADQHLCFRYIDSTIPLLSKSEISSL